MRIVLNESLTVTPMLTSDQLDALSLIFVFRYTMNNGLVSLGRLHEYLDQSIIPFVPGASSKNSAYQHLEFSRCGAITANPVQIEDVYRSKYPGLLCKGFTEEESQTVDLTPEAKSNLIIPCLHDSSLLQVNALNDEAIDNRCVELGVEAEKAEQLKSLQLQKVMPHDEIREYLVRVRPQLERLFEIWDSTPIKYMTLTSVGTAIAHANVRRQTGENVDLSEWV